MKTKSGNVGKAIPGVEIKIAHADESGVGEVVARGPNVMAGYTDDVATAKAIDGDGWLHTGDLGKLDKKGRLVLVSRMNDVVVGPTGENVYPDDVEQRLGSIEAVAELVVLGVSSESGEKVACLAVPSKSDDESDRPARNERARTALQRAFDKLPYGQRPSILHLSDQPLPRTATRKVKRDEVQAILARKIAATTRAVDGGVTGEVRMAITAITGFLSMTTETTLQGDLAFDSLRMVELLEALESRGRTIDPVALQACRTVGEVESLVGEDPSPDSNPRAISKRATIERGEPDDIVLPAAMQEAGKRFVGKLQDTFYGQMMRTRVTGRAFIPHNRNTIVVANHASHLDMGLVRHALGTYGEDIVSLAAQDYFFEGNGLRKAFFENMTNLVAIDRNRGLRAAMRQASDVIASGKTVLLFPEGTRSTTGEIGEWKPMMGQLALYARRGHSPRLPRRDARGDAQGARATDQTRGRRAHRSAASRGRSAAPHGEHDAGRRRARSRQARARRHPRAPGGEGPRPLHRQRRRARRTGGAASARRAVRRARRKVRPHRGRQARQLLLHARERRSREVDGEVHERQVRGEARQARGGPGRLRPQDEHGDLHQDRPRVVHAGAERFPVGGDQVERRLAPPHVPKDLPAGIMKARPRHWSHRLSRVARRRRCCWRATCAVAFSRGEFPDDRRRREAKRGDVTDVGRLREAVAGCDGAIHCAGRVSRRPEDAEAMRVVHVLGTRAVLDACEAESVGRVVGASSSGVVAVSEDPDRVTNDDDETPSALVNQWPYYARSCGPKSKRWREAAWDSR